VLPEEQQPMHIRNRNCRGPRRESEGFIVPFEDKGNITRSEGRNPALFMQPKSGGQRGLRRC